MSPPIQLVDVQLDYGGRRVLDGVSLSVPPAQVLALVGPSGGGKTSLLRLMLGFVAPARGEVRLADELASCDGRVLIPPEERQLAVVFQDLALWPHFTVERNLSFGLQVRGIASGERGRRIRAMLERVDLGEKAGRFPGELSGGERQRVAIARALVLDPVATLFDEPLANLDVALKRELLAQFRSLLRERRMAAVYVTHDLREAAALGDSIAVLEDGHVVQRGTLADLRAAPATRFVRQLIDDLAWSGLPSEPHDRGDGA